MAGCFGNHPVDRWIENQLYRWLDENCDGYRMSDCCNAPTDTDILICMECGEHCGVMCDDCEEDCENRKESYE